MSGEATTVDPNATISHEQDGRTLSGVGTTAEALADVMERHAPPDEPAADTPPASTPPTPDAAAAPKPTRGQARFAELSAARKAAEERAAAIEKQFNDYKASQAATAPQPSSSPAAAPTSPSVPNGADSGRSQQPAATRPQPSEEEVGTKYKTYAEFVVDSARWVTEQQLAAQQSDIDARIRSSIEADRAARDFHSHVERTWAKGRKVYADFDAMRANGPGSQVLMDNAKIHAILQHPDSEHLQYAILKDGALATRLAGITHPIEFGMALASLAPSAAAASLASTATSGSITPPAPMQPVGSGSKTASTPSAEFAANGDYESYKARRAQERSGGRR